MKSDNWWEVYDEESGKTLWIKASTLLEAEEKSVFVNYKDFQNGDFVKGDS